MDDDENDGVIENNELKKMLEKFFEAQKRARQSAKERGNDRVDVMEKELQAISYFSFTCKEILGHSRHQRYCRTLF